jgi:hypothetical protein
MGRTTPGRPLLVAGLALGLALGLAACGNEADTSGVPGSAGSTSSSTPATPMVGKQVGRVAIPGARQPAVLTRQDHARGGYQLHLYVDLGGGPRELTDVHHNPVIPFVATDTSPATPVSADCTGDGFAVTEADPTTPRGVLFAWDVHRTSYQVDGDRAVPLERVELHKSIPDATLRADSPELFSRAMFTHC